MSLNGSLLERAQQAIVATFRREELQQFVHIELEENFEAIARDDNLRVQAYELLLWAGRNGREQFLLDHLAATRPSNADFAAVAKALRTGEPLVPTDSQFVRPPGRGPVPLQKPLRVQHFTGREQELAGLLADLQPGKILTLCGPGGIGKSALAAEAVWRLAPGDDPPERFPDGVIFHTFYHQPQADLALEAIARSYGVAPRPTPRDAARQALAGRRALLVLDGTEEANDLDAVLSVTGGCGLLITTRRHDDAPDDSWEIAPLPPVDSLRLLRAWSDRYATDDYAAGEIVRLLGGLPLALFLAGRYLAQRRQQAGEFAAWLHEQGLAALNFGDRPHKSIPLLMQGSLTKVGENARAAFGVAGVLAFAPFTPEIVAFALDITTAAANHALGELVDCGLLLRPDDSYHVTHSLAHKYARTEVVPGADVINRLAVHYVALAKTESKNGLPGLASLDRQRPHIVAVQAAALQAEQWVAVKRITWTVTDYLSLQGHSTDRIITGQAALDAARAAGDRYDEAVFLRILGNAYAASGEPRRAIELHEQALMIAHEIGDRRGEGAALGSLGAAYYRLGETRRVIELHEQALVIDREVGNLRAEGTDLGNLGNAYADLGEFHRAIEIYERALAILREIGDRSGEGADLGNLGNAYAALGEPLRAINLYEQQLVIVREIGDHSGEGTALGNLGAAYTDLGEPRRAIDLFEQHLVIARESGDRRGESIALGNLGAAYAGLGEPRRSIDLYEQHLVIAREIGDRRGESIALGNLGVAYADLGETCRAIELWAQYCALVQEIRDRREERAALGNLWLWYAAASEVDPAVPFLGPAPRIVEANRFLSSPQKLPLLQSLQTISTRGNDDAANLWAGTSPVVATCRNLSEEMGIDRLYEPLAIDRDNEDHRGEANALGKPHLAYAHLGKTRRAIEVYELRLAIAREIGYRDGEGNALGRLGRAYADLGHTRVAINLYEQQLVILRELGDRRGEGYALGNLGAVYYRLGKPRRAIKLYKQVLLLMREIGDHRGEAIGSWNLGLAYEEEGDIACAVANMQVLVAYEQEMGHADAARHAQRVDDLKARTSLSSSTTHTHRRRLMP